MTEAHRFTHDHGQNANRVEDSKAMFNWSKELLLLRKAESDT